MPGLEACLCRGAEADIQALRRKQGRYIGSIRAERLPGNQFLLDQPHILLTCRITESLL